MRRILGPLLLTAAAAAVLVACGDESTSGDDGSRPSFDYSAELEAPSASDFGGSDTTPDAEDGLITLDLDSGGEVILWIDPDDIAQVWIQHSDPDDPDAWTEPEMIYEAGDGCLIMDAATDGEAVAVGLGCFADDAFIQQAPDEGVALMSPDLATWETSDPVVEFYSEPEFQDDGSVVFVNGVYPDSQITWTEDGGFSPHE